MIYFESNSKNKKVLIINEENSFIEFTKDLGDRTIDVTFLRETSSYCSVLYYNNAEELNNDYIKLIKIIRNNLDITIIQEK